MRQPHRPQTRNGAQGEKCHEDQGEKQVRTHVRHRRASGSREHHSDDTQQHNERHRGALDEGASPWWQESQHDEPGGESHRGDQPDGSEHHCGDGRHDCPELVHRAHCGGSRSIHGHDPCVNVMATSTGADCTALTTAVEPCVFMPS